MPNNAGFLPTFSGKTSLSLSDLDALSAAVKSFHGTEYVPVSGHRGQRRYKLANFNLDQVNEQGHDVYSNEGLVQSVGFSVADEPYISEGEIVLPMAHYFQPEGSETECNGGVQNAVGAVSSIGVFSGLKRPDIVRGNIGLPLADSTECGGAVAGLISAVEVDSEATKPFISAGVLHLTAGGGDECCGGCTCVPAEYVPGSHSTLGLISSIDPTEDITAADIVNGAIRLPLADSTVCGGAVAGLISAVAVDADATSPYIAAGVLHLAGGGGDECCGGCACVPAEYVPGSHSTLGLISSIDPNESILQPDIVAGAVRLPYADTARGAVGLMQGVAVVEGYTDPLICYGNLYLPLADTCGGATGLISGVVTDATSPYISAGVLHLPTTGSAECELEGLMDAEGNEVPWADLPDDICAGIVLSTHYVGSYEYELKAAKVGKFLQLQVIQDFSAT